MKSEKVGNVYCELLTKLMELEPDEAMMVAAALKSSADTAYVVNSVKDQKLMNTPTTGGLQ